MAFHYYKREDAEPWSSPQTWYNFYIRRFFRIAPLYYLLLIAAFFFSYYLGICRQEIVTHFPDASTPMRRYESATILNFLLHITFLFGLHPGYASSTPLPDWSIGLEMQFYAVFPFIMLLFRSCSALGATVLLYGSSILTKHFFVAFSMPSLLPLKIEFFLIGILLASAHYFQSKRIHWCYAITAILISINNFIHSDNKNSIVVLILTILIILMLLYDRAKNLLELNRFIYLFEWLLSNKLAYYLADTSYGVYLLHLLLLVPLTAFASSFQLFVDLPGALRFLILFGLVVPPTYLIAWLLYNHVEQSGIKIGKSVLKMKIRSVQ